MHYTSESWSFRLVQFFCLLRVLACALALWLLSASFRHLILCVNWNFVSLIRSSSFCLFVLCALHIQILVFHSGVPSLLVASSSKTSQTTPSKTTPQKRGNAFDRRAPLRYRNGHQRLTSDVSLFLPTSSSKSNPNSNAKTSSYPFRSRMIHLFLSSVSFNFTYL